MLNELKQTGKDSEGDRCRVHGACPATGSHGRAAERGASERQAFQEIRTKGPKLYAITNTEFQEFQYIPSRILRNTKPKAHYSQNCRKPVIRKKLERGQRKTRASRRTERGQRFFLPAGTTGAERQRGDTCTAPRERGKLSSRMRYPVKNIPKIRAKQRFI